MDDEDRYESLYENGSWEWDGAHDRLEFRSGKVQADAPHKTVAPERIAGSLLFKEDLDLFEQLRFRNRFQRRANDPNVVVTLQDVRDVTLFCAPSALLSEDIINMIHTPLMDRFLRALLFYCQYYIQVTKEMSERSKENKIRTPKSSSIEVTFRKNIEDLRLLVAKEYSCLILGAGTLVKYHHMGRTKRHSYSTKDAVLFETLLRISIHIVWITLGRKWREEIELEVNRLFKSDRFNFVEHKYNYQATMGCQEKSLLLGRCLRQDTMLRTTSPLMNEVFCDRDVDPRMSSLGVQKFSDLCPRLKYLEGVLTMPEEKLLSSNIVLGILGIPRIRFDTMLKELINAQSSQNTLPLSPTTTSSKITMRRQKVYADFILPEKPTLENDVREVDDTFPKELFPEAETNSIQRKKWINRFQKRIRKAT